MEDLIRAVINGTFREQFVILVGAAGALALMTGLFGAWIGAYFGGRRGARKALLRMEQPSTAAVEAQLSELRQALESVALEMERISEGQRFTARMLVERVSPPAPVAHPRREAGSVTPH